MASIVRQSNPVEDYIEEPRHLLMGVQAWPPASRPDGSCPACGWGIHKGDNAAHCLVCDSSSPAVEARILSAKIGLKSKSKAEQAEKRAREKLRQDHPVVLSEHQRRRVFHGCKSDFDSAADVANRAAAGRAWLAEINQLPDWSIKLKRRTGV